MHTLTSLVVTFFIHLSWAHMEMSWPYPIRSPLDPANDYTDIDYSYTSPLLADGSNFPCKGYQTDTPEVSKATYIAGQTYNMTLAGTANHDGGSCQLSLSYDNGQTFKVIESMIGGCPLVTTYNFTIPSFAPSSSNALFAWSWFNLVGNREMYMNCARITIQASNSTTTSQRRRALVARQTSMDSLPSLFSCDISNGCTTIEQEDVEFPDPGSNVIYGTDSIQTLGGAGYAISGVTTTTSVAGAVTTTTVATGTNTTSTTRTSSSMSPTSSTTLVTFSTTLVSSVAVSGSSTTSTSSAAAATTSLSGPCTVGSIGCNSQTTWSECVSDADGSTSYVYMGSVAAGMQCVNGTMIRANSGSCSTDGAIICSSDGQSFYECVNGGKVYMGPVAAGTECAEGEIVYALC